LKQKMVDDLAKSPGMNIFMNAFMMYMTGGGMNIFSLFFIAMSLKTPISSIIGMNQQFLPFAGEIDLFVPKLKFLVLNLVSLSVSLWKLWSIGLLPVSPAEWSHLISYEKIPIGYISGSSF